MLYSKHNFLQTNFSTLISDKILNVIREKEINIFSFDIDNLNLKYQYNNLEYKRNNINSYMIMVYNLLLINFNIINFILDLLTSIIDNVNSFMRFIFSFPIIKLVSFNFNYNLYKQYKIIDLAHILKVNEESEYLKGNINLILMKFQGNIIQFNNI